MSYSDSFQLKILREIIERFPKKSQAVAQLSDLLQVGKDGIYRRINGETTLSTDELYLLANAFQINLNRLLSPKTDKIIFSYEFIQSPIKSFEQYATQILEKIEQLKTLPKSRMWTASHEIPIYMYFMCPELTAFKFYIYGLNTWHLNTLKNRKFSFDILSNRGLEQIKKVATQYCEFPSKELWSLNIIDYTISQIHYFTTIDAFADLQDAILLCRKIEALLDHIRDMAEKGKKWMPGSNSDTGEGDFHLYYNELSSIDSTMLILSELGNMAYTTFGTPNFLHTADQRFCKHLQIWFKKLMENSTSISMHSKKDRNWFINQNLKKIYKTREYLESSLEDPLNKN